MSDDTHRKPLRALVNSGRQNDTLTGEEPTGDEDTIRPMRPEALLSAYDRDPVIGSQVSGYVVKGRLGAGGMGIVYEGEQPVIGKRVAIKVLRPEVAENPDVVQRLVAEARAVNQVGHRGIIDVFGFGQLADGRQCIVMEYLEGESLEHIINTLRDERKIMPLVEVLTILEELLSALGAAHSAGVIHRDLKPSNIFLCQQRDGTRYVKVLDFGIAKLGVIGATPQTNASLMVGTPAYMAPEQARGGMVSPALDLYAVGCIASELITGHPLFTATSVVEMIMKHQEEKPQAPSQKVLSLPDVIDEWVLKLLEKKPENRFASADDARKIIVPLRKELSKSSARMPELAAQPNVSLSPSMHLEAVNATAEVVKRPVVNAPAQQAITDRTPDVVDELPKSSRTGLYVGAALVLVIGVGVAVMFAGGDAPKDPVVVAPVEPVKVVEPVKPVEPVKVVEPEKPVEPVKAVEPEKPVEPVKVVEPAKPVEPVKAVEPWKPVAPIKTVEPKKPVKVVEPKKPVEKVSRADKLLARLKKLEPVLRDDALKLNLVNKMRAKLSGPTTADDLDRLEAQISGLETEAQE